MKRDEISYILIGLKKHYGSLNNAMVDLALQKWPERKQDEIAQLIGLSGPSIRRCRHNNARGGKGLRSGEVIRLVSDSSLKDGP